MYNSSFHISLHFAIGRIYCRCITPRSRRLNPHVFLPGEQLLYQIPNNKVLTTKIGLLSSLREYERVCSKVNHGRGLRWSGRLSSPTAAVGYNSLFPSQSCISCSARLPATIWYHRGESALPRSANTDWHTYQLVILFDKHSQARSPLWVTQFGKYNQSVSFAKSWMWRLMPLSCLHVMYIHLQQAHGYCSLVPRLETGGDR